MKIVIAHARSVPFGWDINVNVTADAGEKISFVEIRVNGFADVDETPDDPVDSWEKQLTQKGIFPETMKSSCWCATRTAKIPAPSRNGLPIKVVAAESCSG